MRIRLSYFFLLIFALFLPNLSFAAVATGPISNATVLAYKPTLTLDTAGLSRLSVPVLAGETAGMATIGTRLTVGRLLGYGARGILGPWGMAAIAAADLCYTETDWRICHSTVDPLVPITIDTSLIVPAENTEIIAAELSQKIKYQVYSSGELFGPFESSSEICSVLASIRGSGSLYQFGVSSIDESLKRCYLHGISTTNSSITLNTTAVYTTVNLTEYSCLTGYFLSDSSGIADSSGKFCTPIEPKCPSSDYILTNSSGGPLSVSGKFCTLKSAYSCNENYSRSDAYGNLGDDGMFCSYTPPALTEQQKADILAPYLLNYYANQLFADKDGKTLPDIFSGSDTTFDTTVTPADMPMTWTDLQKYTGWVNDGTAQTTNPLAPHYISPNNYNYVKNYINTNNQTNTNTDNTTNVSAATSTAMTQTEYEQSNKKADTEQATALNTAMNPLTGVLTQYNADKQFMIDRITSPTEPPAAMPNIFTWAWPTGSCQGFTLKFNIYVPYIGVLSMDKLVNEHCPPYNEWAHPALFWFFNIITGLYLFRLWDKTAAEVVRI